MAVSIRAGMALLCSCNQARTTLLKEWKTLPSAVTQLTFTRGARRSSYPRSWWVKRKSRYSNSLKDELTPENQSFITELVKEKFTAIKSPLKEAPWERQEWTRKPITLRSGVLAIKLGVIPHWNTAGQKVMVTMLQVIDNHVIDYIPPEKFAESPRCRWKWRNKYGCLVVGALSCPPHIFTPQYNNLFLEAGVPPKRKLTRFLVTPNAAIQPGTPLYASHFKVGDYVDCQAKTVGHGFQGVMKRWEMKGGRASHGATKHHRKMGSSGGGRQKKGLWKGKKMPGHMGMAWSTNRGLQIYRINTKYNILYVKGQSIPGPNHCYVRIGDTALRNRCRDRKDNPPSMPTFYPDELEQPLPEEILLESIHNFADPTITFEEESKSA